MSIINQMLQDLDKRRVENRSDGMQSHIRAVPEHKSNYQAWGIGLALAAAVCGVSISGWLWLRNPPIAVIAPVTVPSVVQPAMAPRATLPAPPIQPVISTNVPAPAQPATVAAAASIPFATPALPRPAATISAAVINRPVAQQAAVPRTGILPDPKKQAGATVYPAPTGNLPAARAATEDAGQIQASTASDTPAPALLNKQVKGLTPQQIAENEYRQAIVLIQQGKTADAIAALELTLQHDPQNASARQTFAGLLLESKRPDQAIRKLQEGLTLDPSQTGMAMLLARLQVEKHDTSAAVETLQRSLPHAGERADYQAFMAALLQRQGHHREAAEQYVSALRKSPQNGVWWMGLGISLQADNRLQEAQNAFTQAKATTNLTPELQAFVEQKLQQLQK